MGNIQEPRNVKHFMDKIENYLKAKKQTIQDVIETGAITSNKEVSSKDIRGGSFWYRKKTE